MTKRKKRKTNVAKEMSRAKNRQMEEGHYNKILLILSFVITVYFVISMSIFPVSASDIFHYLEIARRFFLEYKFPEIDPFIYTYPNYKWHITHEWGAYLLFYFPYFLGGFPLLILFKSLCIIMVQVVVPFCLIKIQKYLTWPMLIFILLSAIASSHRFILRASLFTEVFVSLTLLLIMLESLHPGKLKYLFPLVFLCWANVHPGFHIGFFIIFVYLVVNFRQYQNKEYKKLCIVSLVSILFIFINYQGVDGVLFPIVSFFDPKWDIFKKYYFEWRPFFNSNGYHLTMEGISFMVLALLNIVILFFSINKKPYWEFVVVLFFVFIAIKTIRFVPMACYSLTLIGIYMEYKFQVSQTLFRWRTKLHISFAVLLIIFLYAIKNTIIGYNGPGGPRNIGFGINEIFQPINAVRFIDKSNLVGNIFNGHSFGSYLIWHWQGRRKVYFHGAVDDPVFYQKKYLRMGRSKEDFDYLVNKYDINLFILDNIAKWPALFEFLNGDERWKLIYKDVASVVYIKNL